MMDTTYYILVLNDGLCGCSVGCFGLQDWDTSSCSSAIAIGSGDVAVGCVDALVVAFFQIGNPVLLLGFADFLGDLSAVLAVLFADGVLRESSWLIGKLS
jgi:hypothetical protein